MITDPDGHEIKAGSKNGNGGPWWVNAILKLGVTTAIALGLVWFLSQEVKQSLDGINTSVSDHATAAAVQNTNLALHEQQTEEVRLRLSQILQVLQASCVNAARDNGARSLCFSPVK